MQNNRHLGVRLPDDLYAALEAEVLRQRKARPGAGASCAGVVREILYKALLRKPRGER